DICRRLIGILSRVFFPFLNRKTRAFSKYRKMMLMVSIFLTFLCLVSYKLVFWYLNITDDDAFSVLAILAFSLIGITLYDIYGNNYFIIKRQDKLVMNNTLKASLLSFALAFPLIYYFEILGAAISLASASWMMGSG